MASDSTLPDAAWNRHANPLSGWSRLAATPVLFYALYARRWRLFLGTLAFLAVNPVLFPEPESTEGFMHDVVRAEEWWLGEGRPLFGTGYPEVLNVATTAGTVLALLSAVRRRPLGTLVGTAILIVGKLSFVAALVGAYRHSQADLGTQTAEPAQDSS